ncbi:MAG: hypothetical protein HYZ37_06025 [Candidatus Solibacter usitatus]|nr:hypothetical protein [Candidatus Solibacter usitatus]
MARHYRIDLGRNSRISTEITGYAVGAYCDFFRRSGEERHLQAAIRSGQFLLRAWDSQFGIYPFEWPTTETPAENRAFFFDCGIIARGLLQLYRQTGKSEYLDGAAACGRSMWRHFERDGQLMPILQLPSLEATPFGGSWSNNPGCYQLKPALCWLDLAALTGDQVFSSWYETALQRAISNDDAFLPGTAERPRIMDRLHAYCYFLEALLPVADREMCTSVLKNGIEKTARYLREIAPTFARSDVYAQLLRVRLFAAHSGAVALQEPEAEEEARAIPAFQYNSTEARLNGGFSFGIRDGELTPYANPVSTAFCAQALALWDDYKNGHFRASVGDLI